MFRLEKNIPRMFKLPCSVRLGDKISAKELRTRLKLNSMGECLEDKRQQSFG